MRTALITLHAVASILGAVILTLPAPLSAQAPPGRERAAFLFGAFITEPVTEARVDSDSGAGTDINFEDDLGLDTSTTVLRLGGHWWLSERNRLDFSLFTFSRNGSREISEQIEFGDEVFEIDTFVSTESDLAVAKAAYTFAPIVKDRGFLGITGGLHVTQTELSLSEPTLGSAESKDLTAPLPVIGVRGRYDINDRVTLRGSFEWFGIETGDVDGTLRDSYLAVDYGFGRRFAVGLAFNDVTFDVLADEGGSGFRGSLDWGYDGWLLYMNVDFGTSDD